MIGELVAKNQLLASRLQNSLDRLAGINAENQSLRAALKTSASASMKPMNTETRCQHRSNGNAQIHCTGYRCTLFTKQAMLARY